MQSTVTGKNQVSIPAAIARKRGIRPGYRLEWVETENDAELLIKIIPDRKTLIERLRGAGKKFIRPDADPVGDLIRERASEAAEEEEEERR